MPEKEFFKRIGIFGRDRIRIRLLTERGQIAWLLVQYEALIGEKWIPIVRYDTTHGYPHRDVLHPDGTQDKYSLPFDDLKTFLKYAEQDLDDRWAWYREKYQNEVKND